MVLNDTRKIGGGVITEVPEERFKCPKCGLYMPSHSGIVPDECPDCETSITAADYRERTPAITCDQCGNQTPTDKENRSLSTVSNFFVCPHCEDFPVLALQHDGEITSPEEALDVDWLEPASQSEILESVFVFRASTEKHHLVAELLNLEAQEYDSSFNARSISSEDTNILIVTSDTQAIGYLTWTREMCEDNKQHPIIQQVFLLESRWREGIGDTLIEYALEELPESGESVWVNSPNIHMMRVFHRLGLVKVNEEKERLEFEEDKLVITGKSFSGPRDFYQDHTS